MGDSPFDRFVSGSREALTADEHAVDVRIRHSPEIRPVRLAATEKVQLAAFLRPLSGDVHEGVPAHTQLMRAR